MKKEIFRDEEVSFTSAGTLLSGTFIRPQASSVAVLLLSGYGPLDRDSNMPVQKLDIMRDLAECLASAGIASFRYDKRGVGVSEGDYWRATFEDETNDALAALKKLRSLAPNTKLVVVGHSAGASVAMRLAAAGKAAGCVLLAGAATTGQEAMSWQSYRIADTLSFWHRPISKPLFIKLQADTRKAILRAPDEAISLRGKSLNVHWLKEFMTFDPSETLDKITIPILAITGQKDLQVNYLDTEIMRRLVSGPFESFTPDNLTHLLREDERPASLRGYNRQFRMPLSQAVSSKTIDWIKKL